MKDVKQTFSNEAEPTVESGSIYLPMWIIGLLGFLLFWAFGYVDTRGGDYHQQVYEPYVSTNQLASFLPVDETAAQLKLGKVTYETFCVNCHQANGGGAAGIAPPLADSEWVLAAGPNRLIRIPLMGLNGPIKVKGVDYNMNMLAIGAGGAMSDEQIAAVLTYVRNAWGNKASAVSVEAVRKVKADLKDRTDPYSPDDLLKLPVEVP